MNTIGLVQMKMDRDPQKNLERALGFVRDAAYKGAQIICLPELFRTIYFPQYPDREKEPYAETIPGISTDAMQKLARDLGVVLIVPIFEKGGDGCYYNSAVVIDEQGTLLEVYHKVHIPQDPLFYEQNYFVSGDAIKVYKTRYGTFAVLICFDQWFPEAARIATLLGAQLIFYPTAIGTIQGHFSQDGDWHDAWETVMRGHAIANGIYVAAVNRVGEEDRLKFWGQSFVCNSFGTLLQRASDEGEEVLICPIDWSHNQRIREGWGFFRNRHPECYGVLVQ